MKTDLVCYMLCDLNPALKMYFKRQEENIQKWSLDNWIDYGGAEDDPASFKFIIPLFFNNHVIFL